MKIRDMILIGVCVTVVGGLVLAIALEDSSWARVSGFWTAYVLPVVIALLAGNLVVTKIKEPDSDTGVSAVRSNRRNG